MAIHELLVDFFHAVGHFGTWVRLKIKQLRLRRLESLVPFTKVPFWYIYLSHHLCPPMLEPILVVGLGCSLGGNHFDPWPFTRCLSFFRVRLGTLAVPNIA